MSLRRYEYAMHWLVSALLLRGFQCSMSRDPMEGDIVLLQSAPISEWDVSIYRGCGEGGHYTREHLLESLSTGRLGKWHNVGFHVLDPNACNIDERWLWEDAQFDFSDKLAKVHRKSEFYIALPFIDKFDGEMVSIKFRTRFSFDDKITQVPPFEWRKITQKVLMAKLQEYEAIHKQKDAA
jgi:hypothetical protein